jgi:glyoxylase I family protein
MGSPKPMTDQLEAHLIELELRLQSSATRQNAVAVADLLCEDFREFGASGRIWNREALLDALAEEAPHEIVSEGFRCMSLSDELALLTYIATIARHRTLRSSLWRLEAGRWRMLFHQGTPIPS